MKQAGKGDPCVRAIAVKWPPHTLQMLCKHEPGSVWNKKQPMELQEGINSAQSLQHFSRPQRKNFTRRNEFHTGFSAWANLRGPLGISTLVLHHTNIFL